MVKTILSALVVAGLAVSANASSVKGSVKGTTKAGKTAGSATSNDAQSSSAGTSAALTNGGKNVKNSEVLASVKATAVATYARAKAVLSSQAAPLKGTDVESSTAATTNGSTATKNDVSSTGNNLSALSGKSVKGITNAETSATTSAAGKKVGEKVVSLAKEVWAGLTATVEGSGDFTTAGYNAAVAGISASSNATKNALSVRNAVAAMVEMQQGEWNSNRDFNEAVAYYIEEAAIAGFTAEEAIDALGLAASWM